MLRSGGIFDVDTKSERLEEVSRELENPDIWAKDAERAKSLNKEQKELEQLLNGVKTVAQHLNDTEELLELIILEDDAQAFAGLEKDLDKIEAEIHGFEFRRMFSGRMDPNDAYLDVKSGSGGTEAQDWAEMLLRMYLRWGERKGFKTELMEVSAGDVAGIKGATIRFGGEYAYGWLRTELGVHRLVRKSPFDSNNGRHTSFAAVFVSPEINEDIAVDINPAELRIDTYRAQGAGGQHVNKTDSAVRITHVPTGIVVQCQNDRSQHKNKSQAMKQLQARLYQLELDKQNVDKQKLEDNKSDISWGSQIRSYVLDSGRIKDLRTNEETGNTKDFLDGGADLDRFIEASLKQGV